MSRGGIYSVPEILTGLLRNCPESSPETNPLKDLSATQQGTFINGFLMSLLVYIFQFSDKSIVQIFQHFGIFIPFFGCDSVFEKCFRFHVGVSISFYLS